MTRTINELTRHAGAFVREPKTRTYVHITRDYRTRTVTHMGQ